MTIFSPTLIVPDRPGSLSGVRVLDLSAYIVGAIRLHAAR
jgi:hypothetical protein